MAFSLTSRSWPTSWLSTYQTRICCTGTSRPILKIRRSNCCRNGGQFMFMAPWRRMKATNSTVSHVWSAVKKRRLSSFYRVCRPIMFWGVGLILSRMRFLMRFSSKNVNNLRKNPSRRKSSLQHKVKIIYKKIIYKVSWRYQRDILSSKLTQNHISTIWDLKMRRQKRKNSNTTGTTKVMQKEKFIIQGFNT